MSAAALAQQRRPDDRILAIVDDDPILDSEVTQLVGLGMLSPQAGEDERAFRRRVLDFLIEQRLRFHEVDRFGFAEVPVETVENELTRVRERFPSEEEFQRQLAASGIDESGLLQILARQVMVWIYVEERLGARVFVGLDDIQQHYDEVLSVELRSQGVDIPPVQEVREPIRALLRERRMNEEFERWTMELRLKADIEDYFDSRYSSLPPVIYSSDP